jgi:hypothetical protein
MDAAKRTHEHISWKVEVSTSNGIASNVLPSIIEFQLQESSMQTVHITVHQEIYHHIKSSKFRRGGG